MTAGADAGVVTRRLAGLAARYELTDGQIGQLRCVLEVLATDAHAPSTVTAAHQAVDVHLADSLTALDLDVGAFGAPAGRCRVGRRVSRSAAGGRAPGGGRLASGELGTAVRLHRASGFSGRRAQRIRRGCSCGGLGGGLRRAGRRDGARGRAARGPLRVRGAPAAARRRARGVARASGTAEAEAAAERAAGELALESRTPVRSEPYPGSQEHHLHVYVKVGPTPARFPRRPGIASKRPLGVSS